MRLEERFARVELYQNAADRVHVAGERPAETCRWKQSEHARGGRMGGRRALT